MKVSLNKIFTLLVVLSFFIPQFTYTQLCPTSFTLEPISGNNIITNISNNGDLFPSYQSGGIGLGSLQPLGHPFPLTIWRNSLWIGAKDDQGNFKATRPYGYSPGPVINDGGTLNFPCENYDQIWTVSGNDILKHIADFEDNGIIDTPLPSIFSYPALGNSFFENLNGFPLFDSPQGLAPFNDINNDGIYNPENGDFPLPSSVDPSTIPYQISWAIFNDGANVQALDNALNAEIHLSTWLFRCEDNEVLNNTIFTSHKIINRGNENLDSLIVGLYSDKNIGCYFDDYIGSVPSLNTFYAYNQDLLDGTTGCSCDGIPTFCEVPPIQSTTLLNRSLTSYTYLGDNSSTNPILQNPDNDTEIFNLLNGKWKDGTPLTFGGNGYGGTQPTSFAFPDNPNEPTGWSLVNNPPTEFINFKGVGSSFVGNLNPQQFITLDIAHTFHPNTNGLHLEMIDSMLNNVPIVQLAYDENFATTCSSLNCFEDCVWVGDANRDSIVTVDDILDIGLMQGEIGTPRNTPLVWGPYGSENWGNTLNGIDLKHTDCNGNGTIDIDDFTYAQFYYENSYKIGNPPADFYTTGDEICIVSHNEFTMNPLQTGLTGRIRVLLNQAFDIYGLSFTLEFDTAYLTMNFLTDFNIWEDGNNSFSMTKDLSNRGEVHFVSVRTDGSNSLTKDGSISNVIIFKSLLTDYQIVETLIRLKNIKAILNDGTEIAFGSKDLLARIFNNDGEGQILSNENLETENIQIFPNPVSKLLNIKTKNIEPKHFTIFDIYGKKVLENNTFSTSEIQLPIDHLTQGIYFLKIEIKGKSFIKKFVKF